MGGKHQCPRPRCTTMVPDARFACPQHWYELPDDIRRDITAAWNHRRQFGSETPHRRARARAFRWWVERLADE